MNRFIAGVSLRWLILASLAGSVSSWAANPSCEAAIVFRSGAEAYSEALGGIRERLVDAPCHIQYIDLAEPGAEKTLQAAMSLSPKATLAVGVGAWRKLRDDHQGTVLIPALILRGDLSHTEGPAVFADVPLVMILGSLRELLPAKSRVALIHRAPWPAPDSAALARARQLGYDVRVVECSGPDTLLSTFSSLKGKVDLVITEPDTELYNSATVKPLVLASLDLHLPIIGFSAGFVRAGALAGVYPDFHELGRQAGDVLAGLFSGKPHPEEPLRKVVVAFNPRIARLLGVEAGRQDGVVVLK